MALDKYLVCHEKLRMYRECQETIPFIFRRLWNKYFPNIELIAREITPHIKYCEEIYKEYEKCIKELYKT